MHDFPLIRGPDPASGSRSGRIWPAGEQIQAELLRSADKDVREKGEAEDAYGDLDLH